MSMFTQEELAELRAFDDSVEDDFCGCTVEERERSKELDYASREHSKKAQRQHTYRLRNKERINAHAREYQREYQRLHKEKVKESNRAYYKAHKEEVLEHQRQYRSEHKEKISERQKQYRSEHKEIISACQKRYYAAHREKISEYHRRYYATHREEILAKNKAKREAARVSTSHASGKQE